MAGLLAKNLISGTRLSNEIFNGPGVSPDEGDCNCLNNTCITEILLLSGVDLLSHTLFSVSATESKC